MPLNATLAARLQADLRFRAAPLDVRGAYRLLLDFVDPEGFITVPGLDATRAVASALACSHDEAASFIARASKHGLINVTTNGVELLVAATSQASSEEHRARIKRLSADFSYRNLRDGEARRAWLATDDGRKRVASLGLSIAEANAAASSAGRRGRPVGTPDVSPEELQNNSRGNSRETPEQFQSDAAFSLETPSSKPNHSSGDNSRTIPEELQNNSRGLAAQGSTPSPSEVPSPTPLALSEVPPSHTLPSPTSPEPPEPHPPTSPSLHRAQGHERETPALTLEADEATGEPKAKARGVATKGDALPPAPGTLAAEVVEAIRQSQRLGGIVARPNELAAAITSGAFDGIDVVREVRASDAWLVANPRNMKKDGARFLNNWLADTMSKATRRAASFGTRSSQTPPNALGFGAREVIAAMRERCADRVHLTADDDLVAKLDALIVSVSHSWAEAHHEPVTLKHWEAFAAWLRRGGENGDGGIASWWGRDRNGNANPSAGKPGLGYFVSNGRLAKHFDEAMEWWAKYRERKKREMAAAAKAAQPTEATAPAPTTAVSPEERAAVSAKAANAVAQLKAAAKAHRAPTGSFIGNVSPITRGSPA